jgi:cardiolipin synthase
MREPGQLAAFEQSLREEAARRPPFVGLLDGTSASNVVADVDDGALGGNAVDGNTFKLLRDGVEAFPEMLDAIRSARRHIRLEVYMFIDDAVGELFARELAEAARRGVQVTVLYDWLGSLATRRSFFARLRAEGVDIRAFKPLSFARGIGALIRRDHRKILVVDGEIAFVGGINLAAEWAPSGHGGGWRDDLMRVEGPAALMLERLFCASWRMEAHKRLYRIRRLTHRRRLRLLARGDTKAVVLSSRKAIHRAYLRALEHARRSVMISNAYFLPDRRFLAAIRGAAHRGVHVELMLAGKSDHPVVKWAARALYSRMLRWGVEIHEWHEGVLHSKTAVVDGTWGTVGSFNLEPMSLRFNHEANLMFSDPRWGGALARSFQSDLGRCERIDPVAWEARPLWRKALEEACYLLRHFL